jgi:hypothetical protein
MAKKKRRRKAAQISNVNSRFVSVHDHLSAGLGTFLKSARFPRFRQTRVVLTSLIGLLANYREEGQQLFPEVFVLDDLTSALRTLPNSERVIIGSGPNTPETLNLLVKRCAPLAQFGWSIYLWDSKGVFEYGLLRCGLTALSLSSSQQLIEQGDESLPVILIRQISNHTIEVSGANQSALVIHFGGAQEPGQNPVAETHKFCSSIVRDVPNDLKQEVQNFYWRLFERVLMSGHGCLAVVVKRTKRTLPLQLRDGVLITPLLDVTGKIGAMRQPPRRDLCANDTQLRAAAALIRGMLGTDGVTVLRSDGSVMAYNVFVKVSKKSGGMMPAFGGARRRAFHHLCTLIGGDLRSAFFLSQDGHAEFRGRTK